MNNPTETDPRPRAEPPRPHPPAEPNVVRLRPRQPPRPPDPTAPLPPSAA